jgi:thiamine-monophosphate kinase
VRENDLLNRIYARSATPGALGPAIVVGPGDDCAVVRPVSRDDGLTLLTVDHCIEHRHYAGPLGVGTSLDLVARKAVARSVSDIAAMAGVPRWALATAALPPEFPQAAADELFDRCAHWARHWGCALAGGDIASTLPGAPAMLTITVGGEPHAQRGPVLRSGAKPGDEVWLTGRVGGSLPSGRHLTFEPRLAEAAWLADTLGDRLHAMIDLSDGLGRDAARLALASGVRLELLAADFPLNQPPSASAASDGEDYELLFTTAPTTTAAALPRTCPTTGTPLTRIGRVLAGSGCVIIDAQGQPWDATTLGWDH